MGEGRVGGDRTARRTADRPGPGRYCWRADFSGDPTFGVPEGSDSSSNECFVVNPRQPTLSTNAGASPVTLGSGAPLLPRRLTTTDLELVDVVRDEQFVRLTYRLRN